MVYSHVAEVSNELGAYTSAFHHFKIAYQEDEENDQILLEWALCLLCYSQTDLALSYKTQLMHEAEYKLITAAKLGNTHAFYQLAFLYSLSLDLEKTLYFLYKAEDFQALPALEDMQQDAWIDNLKETPAFQNLISKIEMNH